MAASPVVRSSGGSEWGLRPVLRDLTDAAWCLLTTATGFGAGIAVVDGVTARGPLPVVGASLLVFAGDALLRPVLRRLAVLGSAAFALLLGLLAQLLIVSGALSLVPNVSTTGWRASLLVLIIAAAVMAAGRWLIGAGDSSYVLGHLLNRRSRRRAAARLAAAEPSARGLRTGEPRTGEPRAQGLVAGATGPALPVPGLLVVQLDGVSRTLLRRTVDAGLAPTVARWLATGSHVLTGWWAQVPSTTPASQAGLLHGNDDQVVAFRWWDRELERLVVTNRPADAAIVEARMSTGEGLLAGGGVAVSTMFSGDAATSLLVMSRAARRRGLGPAQSYIRFFASPFVLARALLLSVTEMVKELYQGHRQRVRGVLPRVPRRGAYVVLRGITNAFLRDLNVALVAEHMQRGAPVIFVDLVDYDEIAHHAGPERPESLRALEGLDGVLNLLEQVGRVAPRRYRVVVLSDHGQSLGPTFEQVEGRNLTELVRDLMDARAADTVQARSGEEWGPLNALLTSSLGNLKGSGGGVVLGPDRTRARSPLRADLPELAVIASGNLGMVWFPREPGCPDLARLDEQWPALVPGLVACPSIGVVMVRTAEFGPVAIGPKGLHRLRDGVVDGRDPLTPYGPRAAGDLRRLSALAHCGDLVLISRVDGTGRVNAFEGLVGSHGGLGGLQNDALLLHPARWTLSADLVDGDGDGDGEGDGVAPELVGATAVHEQLLRWMRQEGLRGDEPADGWPGAGWPVDGSRAAQSRAERAPAEGSRAAQSRTGGPREEGSPPPC